MVIENDNSRVLEPDLIFSKDGEVLECSERENFRVFEEITSFLLPRLVLSFIQNRRF